MIWHIRKYLDNGVISNKIYSILDIRLNRLSKCELPPIPILNKVAITVTRDNILLRKLYPWIHNHMSYAAVFIRNEVYLYFKD